MEKSHILVGEDTKTLHGCLCKEGGQGNIPGGDVLQALRLFTFPQPVQQLLFEHRQCLFGQQHLLESVFPLSPNPPPKLPSVVQALPSRAQQ